MAASILLLPNLLVVTGVYAAGGDDNPVLKPGTKVPVLNEEDEQALLARDLSFIQNRLAGDRPLTISEAGALRAQAAHAAQVIRKYGPASSGPNTFTGPWSQVGPNPIVQVTRSTNSFAAMSGRIGALAIRSNGDIILGAAQGGLWLWDPDTFSWTPTSDDQDTQSIGALALAPSNDAIVYAGTGEGALSGDSYYGNGILKSTDGGQSWVHVGGDYFVSVSISRIVVDPTNPNHLWAAVIRGRGGKQRTTPTPHSKFGLWESTDGANTWTLRKEAKSEDNGATDIEMDPQSPNTLYASFWQDGIYKSTNGGASWAKAMTGLPPGGVGGLAAARYSISISHPAGQGAVLYVGYPALNADGDTPSRVFKSTNGAASWFELPTGAGADSVEDYCGEQCSYDNVIEADPTNPNIVFAAGQFNYGIGSGGIFRSDDGGQTWKNLGWDQHPDFHALAMNPTNTAEVVMGNDGGVRFSDDRGGRPNASDPLSAADWVNLDGCVEQNLVVSCRTGLSIAQFTSIATVPQVPARLWGGTQDNGTLRKSGGSNTWFDVASGDGGQVLVDPTADAPGTVPGCNAPFAPSCYVYGTFFGISPYRMTDGGAAFFSRQGITHGISLSDRSEFYVPFTMNLLNTKQLFLGTFRLYRTDNARAASPGNVTWKAISPDLTTGCAGAAPNGARGCLVSAIGVGGGTAVYVGTDDGLLWLSPNAQTSSSPTWNEIDKGGIQQGGLPNRPVATIAVDRSNYRIAYVGYNGFNAATPSSPGHVFKTTDGGVHWTNISGNLPDNPVNSLILDPSFPNTLYAGTDVGPFVTYDAGAHWTHLGTSGSFPLVQIWQLDLDTSHRTLAAGTHGRGAFRMTDSTTAPALVVSKVDAGIPVGNGTDLDYTITVRNIGNAGATGVSVSDPIPANTSFVSPGEGGTFGGGKVTWSGISLAAGASMDLHFRVSIANALKNKVKSITNDGIVVTSSEGPGTTGSPTVTPIAPAYAVSVSPANQTGAARAGNSVSYHVTVKNLGYNSDSFNLSSSGGYGSALFTSDCTTAASSTGTLSPGATADICVTVSVPGGASNGDTDVTTVTAASTGLPGVTGSATVTTTAVTLDTLLVDDDGNIPDVRSAYSTALTTAGITFGTWDLAADPTLPIGLLQAYKNVVWFTGNSYPGPILPYEADLKAFLDGGGRLLMSGQDILDQAAGTTPFVHDYLHITWDGLETQNDKSTTAVHGVATTLTDGIGAIPLNHAVLGAAFEDQITPNGTATGIFTDDSAAADGLSFSDGYKVVFLAFPVEAYGTAGDRATLMTRVFTFFGP